MFAFALYAAQWNDAGLQLAQYNDWPAAAAAVEQAGQVDPGLTQCWEEAAFARTRAGQISAALPLAKPSTNCSVQPGRTNPTASVDTADWPNAPGDLANSLAARLAACTWQAAKNSGKPIMELMHLWHSLAYSRYSPSRRTSSPFTGGAIIRRRWLIFVTQPCVGRSVSSGLLNAPSSRRDRRRSR